MSKSLVGWLSLPLAPSLSLSVCVRVLCAARNANCNIRTNSNHEQGHYLTTALLFVQCLASAIKVQREFRFNLFLSFCFAVLGLEGTEDVEARQEIILDFLP